MYLYKSIKKKQHNCLFKKGTKCRIVKFTSKKDFSLELTNWKQILMDYCLLKWCLWILTYEGEYSLERFSIWSDTLITLRALLRLARLYLTKRGLNMGGLWGQFAQNGHHCKQLFTIRALLHKSPPHSTFMISYSYTILVIFIFIYYNPIFKGPIVLFIYL